MLIVLAVVEPNAAVTEDDGAVVALSYVFLVALVMELIRLLLEAVAALSEAMLLLLLLVYEADDTTAKRLLPPFCLDSCVKWCN